MVILLSRKKYVDCMLHWAYTPIYRCAQMIEKWNTEGETLRWQMQKNANNGVKNSGVKLHSMEWVVFTDYLEINSLWHFQQ